MKWSVVRTVGLASVFCAAMLAPSSAVAAIGWSAPAQIDSHAGQNTLTSISCPSSSFCMAVDDGGNNYDGHAVIFNGSTWGLPHVIDTAGEYGPYSVSCTSSSFCAAFDGSEIGLIFNGQSWTPTLVSGNAPWPVSCASSSFCMVGAWGFSGGSWSPSPTYYTGGSAPAEMGGDSEGILSISCPSSSFCMAVGHNGGADTYNGGGWSSGSYDGTGWTQDGTIDSTGGNSTLNSVSCPSSSFCVAVDGNGNVFYWHGSSWSGPTSIDPNGSGLSSVSCPSSSFCAAVDGAGNALIYNGSAWSPQSIDPNGQGLTAVSCASSSFCMALDTVGDAVEYGPQVTPPLGSATLVGRLRVTGDSVIAKVACRGSASCAVTEQLTAIEHIVHGRLVGVSARLSHVVVGKRSVTIAAGHTVTTTIRLAAVGHRLIRQFGKLPAVFSLKIARNGHSVVLTKRSVTIKRHKS